MKKIPVTLRINIWKLNDSFKPDKKKFTQIITASRFLFPVNGSEDDKQDFYKNEIKDYQLLSALYFKIEVFESAEVEYQKPIYIFEDYGVEKGERTHIVE